jgi:hypothetical protein
LKQPRVTAAAPGEGLSAAQQAVQDQMRRALEEDQYSAAGSIVDTESDEDDHVYTYRGMSVRLDRTALLQAVRKLNQMERTSGGGSSVTVHAEDEDAEVEEVVLAEESTGRRAGNSKTKKKKKRKDDSSQVLHESIKDVPATAKDPLSLDPTEDDFDRDGGSIFGATAGSSNSTWVECDKCKKWRRLRGVVDEKKLPTKWYCRYAIID